MRDIYSEISVWCQLDPWDFFMHRTKEKERKVSTLDALWGESNTCTGSPQLILTAPPGWCLLVPICRPRHWTVDNLAGQRAARWVRQVDSALLRCPDLFQDISVGKRPESSHWCFRSQFLSPGMSLTWQEAERWTRRKVRVIVLPSSLTTYFGFILIFGWSLPKLIF